MSKRSRRRNRQRPHQERLTPRPPPPAPRRRTYAPSTLRARTRGVSPKLSRRLAPPPPPRPSHRRRRPSRAASLRPRAHRPPVRSPLRPTRRVSRPRHLANARSASRPITRTKSVTAPTRRTLSGPKIYRNPLQNVRARVVGCVRQKLRREVLFAKKVAGGSGTAPGPYRERGTVC